MVQVDLGKHKAWQVVAIVALVLIGGSALVFFFTQLRSSQEIGTKDRVELDNVFTEEQIDVQYKSGLYDAAIIENIDLLEKKPNDIGAMLKLATIYLQQGSVEFKEAENATKALLLIDQVLAQEPNNVDAHRLKGYAYEIQEKYNEAEAAYAIALKIEPTDADTLSARGHMYDLMGLFDKSEIDYKAALTENPDHIKALLDLASLYIRMDKIEEYNVEAMLDKALALADEDTMIANIFQTYGVLYAKQNDFAEARLLFIDAIEYDDRLTGAWLGAAFAELRLVDEAENEDIAIEHINAALVAIEQAGLINKDLAHVYVLQAVVASYFQDTELAMSLYDEALTKIDGDITLGRKEKETLRTEIMASKKAL